MHVRIAATATACLMGCAAYDPSNILADPGLKAAAEANRTAPHIYDRLPTTAERAQVHTVCQEYVRQQAASLAAEVITSSSVTTVMQPTVERCEAQHFNLAAHNAAVELYRNRPANALPPY